MRRTRRWEETRPARRSRARPGGTDRVHSAIAVLALALAGAVPATAADPVPSPVTPAASREGEPEDPADAGLEGERIPDAWERMREVQEEKAAALFERAEAARLAGKAGTALGRYEAVVRRFRRTGWAPKAQFAIAALYDENREYRNAFDAYQALIDHFRASGLFEQALEGQMRVVTRCLAARRAAERAGRRPSRQDLPPMDLVLRMLEVLLSNARYSDHAARAQFLLAGGLEQAGRLDEALDAHDLLSDRYPDDPLADDAAFQAAYIELKRATRDRPDPGRWEAARLRFELLVARFPDSEKTPPARRRLAEIRALDIRHHLELADYYGKRGNDRAAAIYWRELVDRYPDLRGDERVAEALARHGLAEDAAEEVPAEEDLGPAPGADEAPAADE